MQVTQLEGGAENTGLENARLELHGPMRRGGKCRTGIKRTKNAGVENVGLRKYKH